MMKKFECAFADEPSNTTAVEGVCEEDAAERYVEQRERGGAFAGDPMPNAIEVVATHEGKSWIVTVVPDYAVSFSAVGSEPVSP